MKKLFSLLSVLLLTGFLGACNTTTENDQGSTEQENNETEQSTSKDPTTKEKTATAGVSSAPETLEGTLVASDSQEYAITVIDGFELTAEEPNKDLLFNQENDQQSMRIETFNAKEMNINDVTNNLVEILKASNDNAEVVEITEENQLPIKEFIEEASGFQIATPDGLVSGYTFLKDGLIVKLTVFDTNDTPALESFVEMAETITLK